MTRNSPSPLDFVQGLQDLFDQHQNEDDAVPMKKYMKDKFPFYGIKSQERRKLFNSFVHENGIPVDWRETILLMWEADEREMQYSAMDLAYKKRKELTRDDEVFIEKLILSKSWWDSVDFLASGLAGEYFFHYPDRIEDVCREWIESENIWLNRTCILFQLKYKDYTDFQLLQRFIHRHKYSKEFFIQKAIGWALRQYAKTDAEAVQAFVTETELAPLSRREALKHIS